MSPSLCPLCGASEPGVVANAFGAPRLRCVSCGAWLVPSEGGLREEDPLLLPLLRAAHAAVQELDTSATYSRRRHFFLERGLRGSAVDDALNLLASAMPVPRGEPPEGWAHFVEPHQPRGYRETAPGTRTLQVRRSRRLVAELSSALAVGGYVGALTYSVSPWVSLGVALFSSAFVVARFQTSRWTLGSDRWTIPGRWFGRTVSITPETIEWIGVTRAMQQDQRAAFGVTLCAAGVEHVLADPSPHLSEEAAHGLARLLEEHLGLLPRRLSAKVRVESEALTRAEVAEVAEESRSKKGRR